MTDQNNAAKAVQEAERIAAADEYFKARAWLMDTNDNRRVFEAGFDRAYALLSKLRAPVADERVAFERFQRRTGLDELYLERHATHGQYMWTATKEAWKTWQARAALASAPVAGEALNDLQALQWAEKHGLQWAIGSPATIREVIADAQRLAAPQASEAVRDAPDCEPCSGMGIVDGMGDRWPRDAERRNLLPVAIRPVLLLPWSVNK